MTNRSNRHESGVNFRNLIRDLADMYTQEVEEVIVVELVANALDARATRISIEYSPASRVLTVTDNGVGMNAEQFAQYHDFAAGLKTRGSGIGFAGVGAKISFNVADRVVTETRSESFEGGSDWSLEASGRLAWYEIESADLPSRGTRVEVHFREDAAPSYATTDDLILLLHRNYLPLLDSKFLDLYQRMSLYSASLRFVVNGQVHTPVDIGASFIQEAAKELFPNNAGGLFGFGILGLAGIDYPLGEDVGGVLLCTHGKVIKADLFNQFPGSYGPRIFGLVEVPGFIQYITTSKTDFSRGGLKNRQFERLYGPLRQEFTTWLAGLGVQQAESEDPREAARLERELRRIAESIPELSEFFGFRNNTRILRPNDGGSTPADEHEGIEATFPVGEGNRGDEPGPPAPGDEPGTVLDKSQDSGRHRADPITRRRRSGPRVAFDSRPERVDLAWVEGNTVYINTGHPAYKKADANATSRMVHCIFAIAGAIQRFLAGPESTSDPMFVDRMMSVWGG